MADGESKIKSIDGPSAPIRRYAAFVSYSHADEEIASWLHRKLETYRIPAGLSRNKQRRLGRLFRDRVDLSAAHDLNTEIQRALEASDALIVLCSPRSARSAYVEQEILAFKSLGRGQRIFSIIVDGEPHAAGKPGRSATEECFPRALLFRVAEDGAISPDPEPYEPIAADVREGKDGRENGALKVIAGLIGVKLDELIKREKQAERGRRRRVQFVAGIMTVLAIAAAVAGTFAWWQQGVADARRVEADEQRNIAKANEARAIDNENLARSSEQQAKDNFALAEERRLEAERNATEREIQRALAEANAAKATQNAAEARNTLHRFFATRAWEKVEDGDPLAAARYALAGMNLSPANAREYEAVLASIMHRTAPTETFLKDDRRIVAAFSPDNSRIVSTGAYDGAKVWEVATGKLRFILGKGLGDVEIAAYAPDGRSILTVRSDGASNIWDAETGREVASLKGIEGRLDVATYSPDGSKVLTGGHDEYVRVWDARNGRRLAEIPKFGETVGVAEFSSDAARVVVVGGDGVPRIWDSSSGRLIRALEGHDDRVLDASFSPDGRRVATSSMDATARVWSAIDGHLTATFTGHTDWIRSVSFSPDGATVVSASRDGVANIWDAATGALIRPLKGHEVEVFTASFSPDGRLVVTSAADEIVMVWDVGTGQALRTAKGVYPEFSSDGRAIVTSSADGVGQVWAAPDPLEQTTEGIDSGNGLHISRNGNILSLSNNWTATVASPDGRRVQTNLLDVLATFFPSLSKEEVLRSAEEEEVFLFEAQAAREVTAAKFSPNGSSLLVGSNSGGVLWDPINSRLQARLAGSPVGIRGGISDVSFSGDGKLVAAASHDLAVRVWNAADGKLLTTLPEHEQFVFRVLFSPDGQRVVTSDDAGTHVWRATDGRLLDQLPGGRLAGNPALFSTDSRLLATRAIGGDVHIWTFPTATLAATLQGKSNSVDTFSPDGRKIATSQSDGFVQIWDTATGGLLIRLAEPVVTNVVFSPDGRRIVAGTSSMAAAVWDAQDGRLLGQLKFEDFSADVVSLRSDGVTVVLASKDGGHRTWKAPYLFQRIDQGTARDACTKLLGPYWRNFSQLERDNDPLLRSEWSADRDVCEGLDGVVPIRSAGD